ncbi:hypothetical protein BLOT_016050 [Blomia tropicalis]|nr:hypothetical protein BLOT_016050 [Blomia tropicalis]
MDAIFLRLDHIAEYFVNKSQKNITKSDLSFLQSSISQVKENVSVLCDVISMLKNYESNMDSKLTDLREIISNTKAQPISTKTYSQIVAGSEPINQYVERKQQQNNEHTLIISAMDDKSPVEVVLQVNETIKKLRENGCKTKINNIYKTKKGAIIKVPNEENINTLMNQLKNNGSLSKISKIYTPTPLDPTIVLKSVNKSTDLSNLNSVLCDMNQELADCKYKIKILFPLKSNTSSHDVVLRVAPSAYEIIKRMKHIYTISQVVEVRDKVLVRQCQTCFQFDHNTKMCTNQKINIIGPDNIVKCVNCNGHNKFKENSNHYPNNRECPLYLNQINRTIQRTCYNSLDHDIISSSSRSSESD